jgi:hypothetical protein
MQKWRERENIFKPTTVNDSLHQVSNDNGVRTVNFATSKKSGWSTMFTNAPGPLLMGRLTPRLITYRQIGDGMQVYSMYDLSGELTVILITIWQSQI